jgi:DNA-binding transcriptional regulator YiaG
MPNHPNRRRANTPAANPDPATIRAARETAGLTQTAAGAVVYSSLGAWQQWEAGLRRMHPGLWELFQIKTTANR